MKSGHNHLSLRRRRKGHSRARISAKRSAIALSVFLTTSFLLAPFFFSHSVSGEEYGPCAIWSVADNRTEYTIRPHVSFSVNLSLTNNQDTDQAFIITMDKGLGSSNMSAGGKEIGVELTGITVFNETAGIYITPALAPSENTSFSAEFTVPAGMPPGDYHVFFKASTDDYQRYFNSSIRINMTVNPTSLPAVEKILPSEVHVDPGRTFSLQIEVYNHGNVGDRVVVALKQDPNTIGLPAGWEYPSVDEMSVMDVPADGSNTTTVNITVPPTVAANNFTFYAEAVMPGGTPFPDTSQAPFVVHINAVPYLVVEKIEVVSPYNRVLSRMDVEVRVTVYNPSGIPAQDVPLVLYDNGEEIGQMNISLSNGARDDFVFNVTFSKTGTHTLSATVFPNATAWPLSDFTLTQDIYVGSNPMLYVLFGYIALAIFMVIIVGWVMYDRFRYPAEVSLADIKAAREREDIQPDVDEEEIKEELELLPTASTGLIEEKASVEERKSTPPARRKKPRLKPAPPPIKVTTPTPPPAQELSLAGEDMGGEEGENNVREKMREVEKKIHEARLKGVDTASLESMLYEARNFFASREFSRAGTYLSTIERRLEETLARREKARDLIRDAQALLYSLRYSDVDLSQMKSFFTRAENAFKAGDFAEAIKNAERAIMHGEELEKKAGLRGGEEFSDEESANDFSGFDEDEGQGGEGWDDDVRL